MIRSMTGFGNAAVQRDGVHYAVELRSVNNRYFKAAIRLPDELSALEPALETRLRRRISRGSLTANVSFKDTSAAAAHQINLPALRRYLEHLELVERETRSGEGGPRHVTIDVAALLALPGVVQPPAPAELAERVSSIIMELVDQACDRLLAMREVEGRAIVEHLLELKQQIEQRLEAVAQRVPQVLDEYHQRLRARVEELLQRAQLQLDAADLAREVAIYAERSDISEEVQRLRTHLRQLDQILHESGAEPTGRTLDFLAQELLREANTIGSKSNDTVTARHIVEIKGAIDRIKEQVQNIE